MIPQTSAHEIMTNRGQSRSLKVMVLITTKFLVTFRDPKKKRNFFFIPLRSKKAVRLDKLLDFAWSHSIVTRGSVSL